jgi:SPP1 family predicted phage head-tail adaptor
MNPGQLNCRATLQQSVLTRDAVGQPVQSWQSLGPIWCDIRLLSGLQMIKSDAQMSKVRGSIRIRWRADVTPQMRVVHGSAIYGIEAVLPDSRRRYVDLTVEAIT